MAQEANTQVSNSAIAFNSDIELFLSTCGALEIEYSFGVLQFNAYLQDLMFIQAGGKYKDLGISKRREDSRPCIIRSHANNELSLKNVGFTERWDLNSAETPNGSIALLKLSGVMRSESGISSNGIDTMVSDLRSAYANPNISGVVIETNSGGGESLASSILKSAISERNKPVVGFGHLVASAAYRALAGADEIIMSSDASEAGSIGTMVQLDAKEINAYRERIIGLYGADVPNKNGEFRKALAGDFTAMQSRVDELTVKFHNEIKNDRDLRGSESKIKETLSGKMFDARDAKSRGLVDAIGNMPFAVKRAQSLIQKYK
ncbi:MAG: S49 family peptidase [Shewanella sp.]